MIAYLQALAGAVATGSTREHGLLFFFGTGRNGKWTLLNTLIGSLGPQYTCAVPASVFSPMKGI